jgi:hypothetical protein
MAQSGRAGTENEEAGVTAAVGLARRGRFGAVARQCSWGRGGGAEGRHGGRGSGDGADESRRREKLGSLVASVLLCAWTRKIWLRPCQYMVVFLLVSDIGNRQQKYGVCAGGRQRQPLVEIIFRVCFLGKLQVYEMKFADYIVF